MSCAVEHGQLASAGCDLATTAGRTHGIDRIHRRQLSCGTPQISYRRLLEELAADGLAVHAWAYVPGFDHQRQARDAWSAFRSARRQLEELSLIHI